MGIEEVHFRHCRSLKGFQRLSGSFRGFQRPFKNFEAFEEATRCFRVVSVVCRGVLGGSKVVSGNTRVFGGLKDKGVSGDFQIGIS